LRTGDAKKTTLDISRQPHTILTEEPNRQRGGYFLFPDGWEIAGRIFWGDDPMSQKTAILPWAIFAMALFITVAVGPFTSAASAAQWYPFYGYHRPSYLDDSRPVCVTPPTVETHSPPIREVGVQTVSPAPCRSPSARWYPFYGYNRPSYLDR
jgi:hypothetical protein